MKRKFFQSSIILLIGGAITKILGMLIRIVMSRKIGLEGLSLYMLVLPTFSLFITLAQAGIPLSLSRIVAFNKKNNYDLYFTIIIFLMVYNIILLFIVLLLTPFISHHLLQHPGATLPLYGIAFVIPFTTISSVFRSYFIGKGNMLPPILSNILENSIRLFFMFFLLSIFQSYSTSFIVFILILFNIVSELLSTLFMFLFVPKRIHYSFQSTYLKEVLKLSIPNISSSIIGNVSYFLEPIILFFFCSSSVTKNYGILTGYVFPLILMPSFFMNAISQALLPIFTKTYNQYKIMKLYKILYLILCFIFLFSLICTFLFFFFGEELLFMIYHTSYGISYLSFLSFFCFFLYSQPIISCFFLAIGKTNEILYISIFSFFIRNIIFIIFLILNFKIQSLLLSFVFNVIFTFIFSLYRLYVFYQKNED